jgi:gas vesicle protein
MACILLSFMYSGGVQATLGIIRKACMKTNALFLSCLLSFAVTNSILADALQSPVPERPPAVKGPELNAPPERPDRPDHPHPDKTNQPERPDRPEKPAPPPRPEPANDLPRDIRDIIEASKRAMDDFREKEKELQKQALNAAKTERHKIRDIINELRQAFMEEQKALREEIRQRMKELRDELKDHRQVIDQAAEEAREKARSRRGDD